MAEVRALSRPRLGPYELGERLGSGGMAEVFIARRAGPHGFSKRFAIKRILPQLAKDAHFVSMFCDEARICAALAHPNIVQVVDFGEHDGELFMAMEYVDGVSCAKLLRVVASRGETFPLGAALFITHEVLRALVYAHGARDERGRALGIVHRDVSPGNVLIGRAGEVKLTDFGIVRSAFIDRRTSPGELKGKIGYMSPEQALGHELDPRSDLFTVGILLAEMCLARPLFPGRNELEILSRIHAADLEVLDRHAAEIPRDLYRVLKTALAKRPEDRFASARDFADALREVAHAAGVDLRDTELVPWLNRLGVIASQSGTREVAPKVRSIPSDRPTLSADAEVEIELRLPEGRGVAPVQVPGLVELVVTGRMPPSARVLLDGESISLGEHPVLGALARRGAYAFGTPLRNGHLEPFERMRLPTLLYGLASRRETGLLVARSGRREKRVYFRHGSPVLVASTEADELLGQRLVAQGLLNAAVLDAVIAEAQDSGAMLGAALVDHGVLRPARLLRELALQVDDRVIELGGWTRGELGFSTGDRVREEAKPPARRPGELVTRLVRMRYSDGDMGLVLDAVGAAPIARVPEPQLGTGALGLDPIEQNVIELCSGSALSQLLRRAESAGIAREIVRRAVFIGLSSGVLVSPAWLR